LRKYPFVKQDNIKDCGVSSLLMIIKYYGGFVSIPKLRELTKTNKNGTTAYNLVETLKKLGFESYGIKCDIKDFDKISFPVIAHTIINSYKHFIVIYNIDFKNKKVLIGDPMTKIKKISINEFEKIYNNILIIMYPIRKIDYEKKCNIFTKSLRKQFFNKKFILILFLSLIYVFLNLITIIFINNLIATNKLYIIFSQCLIIILLKNILDYIKNKMIINFNYKNNLKITKEVFSKIIKLPYNFYRNITTGDILTRINDLYNIENMLLILVINYFININLIIISSIFICFISVKIYIILVLIMILYLLLNKVFKKKIENSIEEEKIYKERLNSNLVECITGFETVKGLNIENKMIDKITNINYQEKVKITNNKYNLFSLFKNLIDNLGNVLILCISIFFLKNNQITFSELIIINFLVSYFLEPLNNILDNIKNIKEIIVSIRRINELYYYQTEEEIEDKIESIEFKNVTYKNINDANILEDINLKIDNNEKIMIIGDSGSGKSTFLKLIKNYYKSNVFINGKENKNHKNILYVSQNEILFTDTLYNNITLYNKISNEELNKIIKICHIEEIIKDNNLNMLIEENGFNISGGEKQRIILARTLLTKSDVILLDESLSEVDINLERKILKEILKLNKTILFVSHRKDNLDLFDTLYIFKNKKIDIIKRRE